MTTVDVLHSQSDSGSLSDDFSLLPEASSVQNGDINCHGDECFNFTNMQSALCAAPSDSSIEIHSQLSEIIEENQRLKEQLNKNNSMMEDQINTIQAWRDHMLLSKNQMEENLKKAKEQISYLTIEKSELQERVDDLIKMIDRENAKSCMQCTALEVDLNDMLPIDKGKMTEYLRKEWSYFSLNLQENLKFVCQNLEIQSKSKTNQEEKLRLDCYISMLKYKLASWDRNTDQLASLQTDEETDYEVVRLKTHEGAAQQFNKVLEEFKQEVKTKEEELTRMENEKGELIEKMNEYKTKLQEQEITSKSKYELLTHQLQNECSLSQKYRERCESLQQQIEEYETKLVECRARTPNNEVEIRLRKEIEKLETFLRLEQEAKKVDKEKCEKLQVDYDRISKLLEIQVKDEKEKNEKLSLSECDAKKYMEQVDHLTAKLLETEEKLEDSENTVQNLQSQLEQFNGDGENIPLLKAQIDLYKRDYDQLQVAKNAESDEVERLKKELQKYESSNSSSEPHSSRSPGRRSSEQREQSGVAAIIQCPVCSLGFTTEKAVQDHITRCLEGGNAM